MRADYSRAVRDHRIDLLFVGRDLAALVETIELADALLIENVAVDPGFQKSGYGRRMVAHAEHLAVERGYEHVRLYTNAKFEPNLRLYASLGYGVEREEPFDGGVVVHISKHVA